MINRVFRKSQMCGMLLICMLLFVVPGYSSFAAEASSTSIENEYSTEKISELERYIQDQISENEIPGLSVALVHNGSTYTNGFGSTYNKEVSNQTLFELGSNTKAFTALAIHKLQDQSKINMNALVTEYLPWFTPTFEEKPVAITVEQLLNHTSGMPSVTISDFVPTSSDSALEDAVKGWADEELNFLPGSQFEYATTNYSVLGLLIQNVSGISYEQYINDEILLPLGMEHTYVGKENAVQEQMSGGYKLGFFKPNEFDSPVFRGNTPGGYIVSNADDMALWMEYQLGIRTSESIDLNWMVGTQMNSSMAAPYYSQGWFKEFNGSLITHGGSNPTFSSYVLLFPNEKIGITVLANINSQYPEIIARGIDDILHDRVPSTDLLNPNLLIEALDQLDAVSVTAVVSLLLLIVLSAVLVILVVRQIKTKKRTLLPIRNRIKMLLIFAIIYICASLVIYFTYQTLTIMGFPISFVLVWGPTSFPFAMIAILLVVFIMISYSLVTFLFPKLDEKYYFILITFSILSGFGNAAIIFIVIQALRADDASSTNLVYYFLLSIGIYVISQRYVRNKLIRITNQAVYEKRKQLIHTISKASYEKLEKIGDGSIQTVLNNDTAVISNFAGMFIGLTVNTVTLIFCFIYLGFVSLSGLMLSIVAIIIAGGLYFFIGREAQKFMEMNRTIQETFFGFIGSLSSGMKELQLNKKKSADFKEDMVESVRLNRDTSVAGQSKFTNVTIMGEIIFLIVIGLVVFLFPILFKEIGTENLMDYVFVFLYMTGPVNAILSTIPGIFQYRVSWNRMNKTIKEIQDLEDLEVVEEVSFGPKLSLRFANIVYQYNKEEPSFTLGPLTFECHTGEVIFVTGGNGSGKSTFAKILTGLYTPDGGTISINGTVVRPSQLKSLYSAIYSDFHLFEKLYGLQEQDYLNTADDLLRLLDLQDKVSIENGTFSTLNLSTGQRKRLALLISKLENKPLVLFDEWAADQDPEYRRFFYETLLPEMKQMGIGIIAITHDDRYFHLADKVIKLEMGKIVDDEEESRTIAG